MYETRQKQEVKQETKNAPEKRFNAAPVTASVWQNAVIGKNGQTMFFRTFSLQRAYKDKNGAWQHTNSLRLMDLPKAALVLQKAYEYAIMAGTKGTESSHSDISEEMIEEI
ncbi:MAG TPA: hypothetical protein VI564_07030 [Candidatus Nanoarchaeia archaeon]|nr:hypothetical protein [Candidatus Nanoarchaeia archaeon]